MPPTVPDLRPERMIVPARALRQQADGLGRLALELAALDGGIAFYDGEALPCG